MFFYIHQLAKFNSRMLYSKGVLTCSLSQEAGISLHPPGSVEVESSIHVLVIQLDLNVLLQAYWYYRNRHKYHITLQTKLNQTIPNLG